MKTTIDRSCSIASVHSSRVLVSFYTCYGKRFVDFFLAAFGLLILGIPMLCVGFVILLVDGSPVIYKQRRVGKCGSLFSICKFRTMHNRPEVVTTITVSGDNRIFPLGRALRRYKIDELPQLINVLNGEMSFVGPRPDVPGYADQLKGEERIILSIRPGITGPATLAFRNEEKLLALAADPRMYNDEVIYPEKTRLNIEYAKSMTFLGDIRCILKTISS